MVIAPRDPIVQPSPDTIEGSLTVVFAIACGLMVANLYYGQALIGEIAPALGLHAATSALAVTLTQLGYGAGSATAPVCS